MTYREAVARVLALRGGEHAGMRPGLERIEALLDAMGNPERRFSLVQVGGTNGKGSVSAMLAAILKAAGHRVGLYTSPHLISFRERIRVNGEAISEDGVADGVEALGTLIARADATMFEATTALALDHFAREAVDVAVLEVGLGGRLDATTVGQPAVTVITRIDLDHEEVLGGTLPDIAGEKAAIIRSGLAVSAAQDPVAAAVIAARAARLAVPLLVAGRDLHVAALEHALAGQRIACAGPGFRLDDAELALLGDFQPENALLAVAAAHALGASETAMRRGLAVVQWPGRFEVRGEAPRLVLDAAHNVAGARALARNLAIYFGGSPITVIAGISRDKDARAMLEALEITAKRLILTAAAHPRATDPDTLARVVDGRTETAVSIGEALARARAAPAHPVIAIAGSLFLVGDALRHLDGPDKPCSVEKRAASMDRLAS